MQDSFKLCALQVTVLLEDTRPAELSPKYTHASTHLCRGWGECIAAGRCPPCWLPGCAVCGHAPQEHSQEVLPLHAQSGALRGAFIFGRGARFAAAEVCLPAGLANLRSAGCLVGCIMVVPDCGDGFRTLAVHVLPYMPHVTPACRPKGLI